MSDDLFYRGRDVFLVLQTSADDVNMIQVCHGDGLAPFDNAA